jgi:DNA-binding ferritin-like protein
VSLNKKTDLASKLKEVENQGAVVTLEAKIELVQNEIDTANERLNQIDENADLAELMDKMKLKEMRKSVSVMEKEKANLEKMYERMCGKAYQRAEMVDEISLDDE